MLQPQDYGYLYRMAVETVRTKDFTELVETLQMASNGYEQVRMFAEFNEAFRNWTRDEAERKFFHDELVRRFCTASNEEKK